MTAAFQKAVQAMQRQDWPAAELGFTQTLKDEPDNARAMIYLLLVRKRRRKLFRSFKLMNQALALAPEDVSVLNTAGSIHAIDANYSSAIAMFKRARTLDPHKAHTHAVLAWAYLATRKKAECEAAFTEALRLNPKDSTALEVKGRFEMIFFDAAKAEQAAKLRLTESPESSGAHIQTGRVCLAKGDVPQAYWHFREALRLSPNSEEAREALISALVQRFPLYNWLHRLSVRTRRYRVVSTFGIYYVLIRIVGWATLDEGTPPAVRSVAVGLAIAVGTIIALIVLPLPIVNFAMRFHPVGRYALTRSDKFETGLAALVLLVGLSSLVVGLIVRNPALYSIAAFCGFSLFFVTLGTTVLRQSSLRVLVVAIAILIFLVGPGAVLLTTDFLRQPFH